MPCLITRRCKPVDTYEEAYKQNDAKYWIGTRFGTSCQEFTRFTTFREVEVQDWEWIWYFALGFHPFYHVLRRRSTGFAEFLVLRAGRIRKESTGNRKEKEHLKKFRKGTEWQGRIKKLLPQGAVPALGQLFLFGFSERSWESFGCKVLD